MRILISRILNKCRNGEIKSQVVDKSYSEISLHGVPSAGNAKIQSIILSSVYFLIRIINAININHRTGINIKEIVVHLVSHSISNDHK